MADKLTIKDLLQATIDQKASDLHLVVGSPPQLRVDGVLKTLPYPELTVEQTQILCEEILDSQQKDQLDHNQEVDLSFSFEDKARFRVNAFKQQNTYAAAFRLIPQIIPNFETLGLPDTIKTLTERQRGLILVTGPTGSGKSTTLAAMIDHINATQSTHIITIEDPIEYIHHHKKALLSQRELGKDTESFQEALKYALRQDPDVVLVGEMRDLETIQAAITIAETGHLVFATLHTNTAAQTINRIIDVFPPHQQSQVRSQLALSLEGVLSQQLIPKVNGGRALALEILIPSPAIRNLIRENKIHQIESQMLMGQSDSGMITMDQSLAQLLSRSDISQDEAVKHAAHPSELNSLH
jgi:twitching motility protein PilT